MALVVESGVGLSNANSFSTAAAALVYFTDHGGVPAEWTTATAAAKDAALIAATDFMEMRYRWPGWILVSTQALSWPRSGAYDRYGRTLSGVPATVAAICCILAAAHLTESLHAPIEPAVEKEEVGEIATWYREGGSSGRSFSYADDLARSIGATFNSQPILMRA